MSIHIKAFQLAFVLSFLPLLGAPSSAQEDSTITVATWNVEWFFDDNLSDNRSKIAKEQSPPDKSNWEWKRNVVADAIAKMKPTILALQEVENRDVLFALTNILKEKHQLNYRIAFIDGFDTGTEQDVAFLYRSGLVEFSRREQTKEQFDSQQYYNLSKHLFGRFEWDVDGRSESLLVLNVHFRAKAEESALRLRQSRLARLWLKSAIQSGQNVIFLGDTNIEEPYGQVSADGEMAELLGRNTAESTDDLVEAHQWIPENSRRTHMILDKQFDRVLLSPSLVDDTPGIKDLVLEKAQVLPELNIRGNGPNLDHWDTRFTSDFAERDISDHYPVMVTLRFQ